NSGAHVLPQRLAVRLEHGKLNSLADRLVQIGDIAPQIDVLPLRVGTERPSVRADRFAGRDRRSASVAGADGKPAGNPGANHGVRHKVLEVLLSPISDRLA